jgi:hypothetical protein
MAPPTYAERVIDLTIAIGQGSFGESGADKVTFRGHRVFVEIELATQAPPIALIRVYGLTLSQINQLTRAGLNWEAAQNTVLVQAGDKGGQLKSIFEGLIFIAAPDFNTQPEVSMVLTANAGREAQLKPVKPNSFRGSVSAETVIGQIVKQTGFKFENKGVKAQLDNPYFPGTAWDQLDRAAQAANCFFHLDSVTKTISIWPKKGNVSGSAIEVSPATGMINYPEFDRNMIKVRTQFDPDIKLPGTIEVKSQLTAANGTWSVVLAGHTLETQQPNGPWETHVTAVRAGGGAGGVTTDQIVAAGGT